MLRVRLAGVGRGELGFKGGLAKGVTTGLGSWYSFCDCVMMDGTCVGGAGSSMVLGPWSVVLGPGSCPECRWLNGWMAKRTQGVGLGWEAKGQLHLSLCYWAWALLLAGVCRKKDSNDLAFGISCPGSRGPDPRIPWFPDPLASVCLHSTHLIPYILNTPFPFFLGFVGTTIRPMKYACWINIIRGMRVNTFVKIWPWLSATLGSRSCRSCEEVN